MGDFMKRSIILSTFCTILLVTSTPVWAETNSTTYPCAQGDVMYAATNTQMECNLNFSLTRVGTAFGQGFFITGTNGNSANVEAMPYGIYPTGEFFAKTFVIGNDAGGFFIGNTNLAPSGYEASQIGIYPGGQAVFSNVYTSQGIKIGNGNVKMIGVNLALDASERTDGIALPSGSTAQRPTSTAILGTIRYNSQTDKFEGATTKGWVNLN